MTVVFIFWGSFGNHAERDAILCAQRRSGCPVIVISDERVPGVEWYDIRQFKRANIIFAAIKAQIGQYVWKAPTVARWLVLQEFLSTRPEARFPIFCADWDVLIFTPLEISYAPFMKYDLAISGYYEGDKWERSAAYAVNNPDVLRYYCDTLTRMTLNTSPFINDTNDMTFWSFITDEFHLDAGNLFETKNGGVFDHNIAVCDGRFRAGPDGYKDVQYDQGNPFFTTLEGEPVKAHTLHCWGQWKSRTGEQLKMAGIA